MTTINDIGIATITDKDGVKLQVQITEEMISEALKLPTPQEAKKLPYHLTEQEKEIVFRPTLSTKTFKDLRDKKLAQPLRLYSHHFAMGRPQKYTHPNKRVAGFMAKAMAASTKHPGDFSRGILSNIQSYKKSKGRHSTLAGGLMLTRIAYQVVGMIEDLPAPLTANEASAPEEV